MAALAVVNIEGNAYIEMGIIEVHSTAVLKNSVL